MSDQTPNSPLNKEVLYAGDERHDLGTAPSSATDVRSPFGFEMGPRQNLRGSEVHQGVHHVTSAENSGRIGESTGSPVHSEGGRQQFGRSPLKPTRIVGSDGDSDTASWWYVLGNAWYPTQSFGAAIMATNYPQMQPRLATARELAAEILVETMVETATPALLAKLLAIADETPGVEVTAEDLDVGWAEEKEFVFWQSFKEFKADADGDDREDEGDDE